MSDMKMDEFQDDLGAKRAVGDVLLFFFLNSEFSL